MKKSKKNVLNAYCSGSSKAEIQELMEDVAYTAGFHDGKRELALTMAIAGLCWYFRSSMKAQSMCEIRDHIIENYL